VNGSSGNEEKTVLFYGHMDKQPPFEGWSEGLHPYKPVVRDGLLYGKF
jgi:acetylornithine deacetylase/succinyl-diaminopimelate desuccinylase-like protein